MTTIWFRSHEPAAGTDSSGTVTAGASTSGASLASATQPAAADPAQVPRVAHTMAVGTTRLGKLHQAAHTLLDAWDNRAESLEDLTAAAATLRATLAATAAAPPTIDHSRSRPETKQAQVLAMLARSGGASGPQIAEATGWASHTVRGFLAGLVKKGINQSQYPRAGPSGRPNEQGA